MAAGAVEEPVQHGGAEPAPSGVGPYGHAVEPTPPADERETSDRDGLVAVAHGGVERGPAPENPDSDGQGVGVATPVDGPPQVEPVLVGRLGDGHARRVRDGVQHVGDARGLNGRR